MGYLYLLIIGSVSLALLNIATVEKNKGKISTKIFEGLKLKEIPEDLWMGPLLANLVLLPLKGTPP